MDGTAIKMQTSDAAFDLERRDTGKAVEAFDGVWLHRHAASPRPFEAHLRDQQPLLRVPALRSEGGQARAAGGERGRPGAGDPRGAAHRARRPACRWPPSFRREAGITSSSSRGTTEFKQARVLVGPVRIPRTANGAKLMKLPRVQAMDLADPLPEFRGQLDAVLFHGLVGPADHRSAGEGGKDTKLTFMRIAEVHGQPHARSGRRAVAAPRPVADRDRRREPGPGNTRRRRFARRR